MSRAASLLLVAATETAAIIRTAARFAVGTVSWKKGFPLRLALCEQQGINDIQGTGQLNGEIRLGRCRGFADKAKMSVQFHCANSLELRSLVEHNLNHLARELNLEVYFGLKVTASLGRLRRFAHQPVVFHS